MPILKVNSNTDHFSILKVNEQIFLYTFLISIRNLHFGSTANSDNH